jgi:two-component system nitrate/nitrite response regulator NarP
VFVTVFAPQNDLVTRVLIADDHQLVREMISSFLSSQPGFLVSVAESYQDAYKMLHESEPFDVVLLDVQMQGMEGIRTVETLVREFSSSSIVIFSGVATNQFIQEALKAGAKGYIPKTLPFKSLLTTIRLVASGESFVPSSFVTRDKREDVAKKFSLSESELSVLRMVCAGLANKEIAREMETTEVLIKMHMRGICKRLGAKNRTQAAVIALREQLA